MSWINSSSSSGRLGANNSNTATTTNNMIQTSPATFGQQQWSPPHNKQQFLQNQPPPPSSSSFSNQSANSNWFNPGTTTNTLEPSNLSQPPPPPPLSQQQQQQPFGLHQQQNFFSHPSQQPTVPTQPPQQINNSSLFLKSQQQQQPQQQLDNQIYQQQQQQPYYPGQFQNQLPFNQQQNQNSTLNATPPPTSRLVASQNFIKSEQQMTSSTNIQQQQQPQQQNLVVATNNNDTLNNNQSTDGWGDWGDDWGDNNNQVPIHQNQSTGNQNLIEESFKTESIDNWQWNDGIDQKPVISNFQDNQQQQKQQLEKKPEITNHSTTLQQQQQQRENGPEITLPFSTSSIKPQSNIEDQSTKSVANAFLQDVQSSPPPSIFNQPHTFIQTSKQNPVQQTVHSSPVISPQQHQQKNLQAHHQDLTIENSEFQKQQQQQQQQNALASAVYVSQAKPVSQPTRQYAMTPPLVTQSATTPPSSSTNSITNSLPLAQPTSSVAITPTLSRKDSLPKTQIPHPGNSQSPGVGGLPPPPPSQTPPDQQQNSNFNSSSSFPPPPPLINQADAGAGTPNTFSISSNPYKRTGQAQHHRSFIAAPPKTQPQVPVMPSQFFAPPPPPEDFQNSIAPPSSKSDFQQNQSADQNLGINQECLSSPPDNSEIVDRNFEVENFEVTPHTPNDDRNQYLQTSHLSEDGFNSSNNRQNSNMHQEINFENDSFPPPGLSRFVLGEPEAESQQNSGSSQDVPIPPGLDRMIPGTELNNSSDLNMERQADGQDTIPSPTNAFTNVPPVEEPESSNLDITTDRNLYLVPGESDIHEQRVVTGLENGSSNQNTVQRDIEMEGENLEDQQQQQQQQQLHQQQQQQHQHHHHDMVDMSREEPIEGANTLDAVIGGNHSLNHETESSLTLDTNLKDHSNVSTGNDESDHRDRQISYFSKTQRRAAEEKMKKKIGATGGNEQGHNDKRKGRYETEDSDLSSERERRRYREGSARNDRDKERDGRERDRKDKREGSVRDTDRDRYKEDKENRKHDNDRNRNRDKYDKERGDRGISRYGGARYETDSKYETESSVRYERRRGDRDRDRDRLDRDRDRGDNDYRKSEERDRRYHRKDERNSRDREYEREKDDTIRRRRREGGGERGEGQIDDDRDYRQHRNVRDRDDRRDRRRDRDRDRERDRDYREGRDKRDGRSGVGDDDYARKGGSRNARGGERDKDRLRSDRSDRDKDPSRYPSSQVYGYSSGYGYDPYTFYQQQQYYEQLRRTNPQAYAEWYRKYYAGHHQSVQSDLGAITPSVAGTTVTNLGGTAADGRESVHSGRSSTNDKQERYSVHSLHSYYQQHAPSDYHRQQQQQQQQQQFYNSGQQSLNSSFHYGSGIISGGDVHHHQSIGLLKEGLSTGNLLQHQQQQQQLLNQTFNNYMRPPSNDRNRYYAQSDYSESRPDNHQTNLIDTSITSITTTTKLDNIEPQRLTPCKFINEHSICNLSSAGLMICIKPKYSQNNFGITNIVKLLKIGTNDSIRRLYQQFPGPLVHGLTHKKTIIEFCEDQIRLGPISTISIINSRQNSSNSLNSLIQQQINKASFTLMWNLLILLLRQNGMVVGTDIAELLMKNKQQFPYENSLQQKSSNSNNKLQRKSKSKGTASDDDERSDNNEDNNDNGGGGGGDNDNNDNNDENDDSNSNNSINNSRDGQQNSDESVSKVSLNEELITDKFRNYLLYGNVNEALEWATDNNLWGHALFLASKVDRRLHANVMMKFANKLSLNDPLQTLYQMMSGRTPSSVTSVQDEKWGDWRPHLAMILSNTSQRPDLDRKSITTLGDSLYNRGDLFGAQFCYLMAQIGFGKYSSVNRDSILIPNSSSAVRLILLGSSQHKPFKEFATNEAIMMTEIYEYACTLNDDKFSIAEFQPYKYLLATRMLDYGLQLKTLMYMEQISLHIQRDPSKYDPSFIEKVFNLAERLKFYDPVLEKTMDDEQNVEQIQDQKWLQDLRDVIKNYCTGNNLNESIMVGENNGQQQQQINSLENTDRSQTDQQYMEINKQFAEINQQFSELNMQYNNFDPIQQQTSTQQQQQQQQQFNQIPPQQHQQQSEQDYHSLNPQSLNTTDQYGTNQNQYYGPSSLPNLQQDYNSLQSQNSYNNGMMSLGNIPQHEIYDQQNQNFQTDDQQQQQQTMTPSYDYWNQQQQQNEFQTPKISMPNSMSNKSGFYDDTTTNDERMQNSQMQSSNNNNISSGDLNKNKSTTTTSTNSKTDNKNQNKNGNQSNTNSGWFGGIWNKLSLKPKNQMILPDDKNPAIVWDPEKKKWVNKDGEENEQEGFKPPPKMSDIMPISQPPPQQLSVPTPITNQQSITPMINYGNSNQQQIPQTNNYGTVSPVQQQQIQQMPTVPLMNPSSVMGNSVSVPQQQQQQQQQQVQPVNATKTPNLQSNMFKMQRNRTLKKSYVDVFNPSGAAPKPTESVLAPTLPPVNVPQSGFFVPAPIDDNQQLQQVQPQQQQQQVQDNVPQFYDPNQFAGY